MLCSIIYMDKEDETKKNEDPKVVDKSGVSNSNCGVQVCITCFEVEQGHNFEACKLREEIRIMATCREIEGMIERNSENIRKMEKVEADLSKILRDLSGTLY